MSKSERVKEAERAAADLAFWEEFGEPLGLKPYGWTYRNHASFVDDKGVVIQLEGNLLRYMTDLRERIVASRKRENPDENGAAQ